MVSLHLDQLTFLCRQDGLAPLQNLPNGSSGEAQEKHVLPGQLLFSFTSPEEKNEFLNLVRSNEDMGNDYIIEFTPPTTEEIRNARPFATVLPHDALARAMLIAVTLCARTEDDRAES